MAPAIESQPPQLFAEFPSTLCAPRLSPLDPVPAQQLSKRNYFQNIKYMERIQNIGKILIFMIQDSI
jgi:hypothetical protein